MKKLVIGLVTMLAVAAVFTVFAGAAAPSTPPKMVDSGFPCGVLDGNGNIFVTNNSELWAGSSRAWLRCTGSGAAGPPPHPKTFNFGNTGLSCGMLQYGSTTDWTDTVDYFGKSRLTCYQSITASSAASSSAGIG